MGEGVVCKGRDLRRSFFLTPICLLSRNESMAHRGLPLERAPPLAAYSSSFPSSVSSRHGWFQTDARGVVLRRQRGVVRANCMDNLDRTNVVQSVLARRAILNQLRATAGADASALEDAGKECIIHSSSCNPTRLLRLWCSTRPLLTRSIRSATNRRPSSSSPIFVMILIFLLISDAGSGKRA